MAMWLLAIKNLLRNPRRTLVTGFAITIGFVGINVFKGFVFRATKAIEIASVYHSHLGHFSIIKKGWLEKGYSKPKRVQLSVEEQKKIFDFFQKFEDLIYLRASLFTGLGIVSNGCNSYPFLIKGVERNYREKIFESPDYLDWNTLLTKKMIGSSYSNFTENESPILTTKNLAKLLSKSVLYKDFNSLPPPALLPCNNEKVLETLSNDPSVQLLVKNVDGGFSAMDANIVGLFSIGFTFLDDISIESSLEFAQKLFDTNAVSRIMYYLKKSSDSSYIKKNALSKFKENFPNFEMLFYDDEKLNPFYTGATSFLNSLFIIFFIIVFITIILTIINSLTINIIERSKEIGTFRALGFNEIQLASLLSKEMVALTFFSLVLGIILSYAISLIINNSGLTFRPPKASNDLKLVISIVPEFLWSSAIAISLLVFFVSYWLTKRRIKINIANLLVD